MPVKTLPRNPSALEPVFSKSLLRSQTFGSNLDQNGDHLHLHQAVSLLERAINASSCGMTITDMRDPAQPLIFANAAFERITGYTCQEVVGKNCRFLQGPERQQPALTQLRAALLQGTDCTITLQNYRKDGTPFWNELVLSPVRDAEGTLTHFIGVQTDITRRRQAEEELRQANDLLEKRVLERTRDLEQAYDATLEGWVKALDIRDHETQGHTQRVTQMAMQLAQTLGMDAEEQLHIRRGALLHDIGKIGIPDHVLLKPSPLDAEEWETMKKHPVYAYQWLFPIEYLRPALAIPYCHHERWDGAGYPCGLVGEEIPLAARLFAMVDVWDALSSDRPYRQAWTPERVLDHLRSLGGTHFDPQVLKIFVSLLAADMAAAEKDKTEQEKPEQRRAA
jgi:PAS domain S-box-containing protein